MDEVLHEPEKRVVGHGVRQPQEGLMSHRQCCQAIGQSLKVTSGIVVAVGTRISWDAVMLESKRTGEVVWTS